MIGLTFRSGTPASALDEVVAALRTLPGVIPEIRRFDVGPDLGLADGNADVALVADFDDADAWRRYQEHPEHVRVIAEHVRPILEHRVACQFEV
jgi:hypothetical protein